jgi:predicted O-linked N-acetylglucosamine transferase (SPINDLY family)
VYRHERIRVGYLSADFRTHPVGMLMAGVFEHHDRGRIEPIAFSYGLDDASSMRSRLAHSFERFHDVRSMSDASVASLIAENEIDILVDLTGLTASARPGILALRAAPVQVNYLGFAGSMGAPFIDYIIADRIVIPEAQQVFYTEKVAYLPHCYLPHDRARRVAAEKPSRSAAGLPERGFVFASFNNSYKFSPRHSMLDALLRAVDGSVLMAFDSEYRRNPQSQAGSEARGVDPARLISRRVCPRRRPFGAAWLADLFLDTLPYNAHTTAMDALWAGFPC